MSRLFKGDATEMVIVSAVKLFSRSALVDRESCCAIRFLQPNTGQESLGLYTAEHKPVEPGILAKGRDEKIDQRRERYIHGSMAVVKRLSLRKTLGELILPRHLALKSLFSRKPDVTVTMREEAATVDGYAKVFGMLSKTIFRRSTNDEGEECRTAVISSFCPLGDLCSDEAEERLAALPLQRLMDMFAGLLAQVDYFHKRSNRAVLDIKPDNVLLAERAGKLVMILADLGDSLAGRMITTTHYKSLAECRRLGEVRDRPVVRAEDLSPWLDGYSLQVLWGLILLLKYGHKNVLHSTAKSSDGIARHHIELTDSIPLSARKLYDCLAVMSARRGNDLSLAVKAFGLSGFRDAYDKARRHYNLRALLMQKPSRVDKREVGRERDRQLCFALLDEVTSYAGRCLQQLQRMQRPLGVACEPILAGEAATKMREEVVLIRAVHQALAAVTELGFALPQILQGHKALSLKGFVMQLQAEQWLRAGVMEHPRPKGMDHSAKRLRLTTVRPEAASCRVSDFGGEVKEDDAALFEWFSGSGKTAEGGEDSMFEWFRTGR